MDRRDDSATIGTAMKNQINLLDPDFLENPYPTYEALRDEGPIHKVSDGIYVAARFEEVERGLRDFEFFSRDTSGYHDKTREYRDPWWKNPGSLELFRKNGWVRCWPHGNVINSDPPMHSKYRKMINPMFNPARVRQAEPLIRRLVDDIVADFIDEKEIDFVERFAKPLPMRLIIGLIGFPEEDTPILTEWSDAMGRILSGLMEYEEELVLASKLIEFQHYVAGKIEERRREPKDDILSYLATIPLVPEDEHENGYTLGDLISLTSTMHIGGNESTTNAFSSGIWLLHQNPGTLEQLQADPSLIPTFVEEVIRLESPFQTFSRSVRQDVALAGVALHKNDKVDFRIASANRDPRRFKNPEKLDLHRESPMRHLGFSTGIHNCLGAGLARFEMKIAFEELFKRMTNIRVVPGKNDFSHMPHAFFRGLNHLWITFDKVV